ncbi:hypothetical protein [Aliagarivorans taiwanensis]|uniref:hypothetical protein n=1 Tax=Aliagarivorans taiwanensis TaxID=561966 RepID=UPI000415F06B|nr:hypothetical protein [Aliagarivorans taiwanensis]
MLVTYKHYTLPQDHVHAHVAFTPLGELDVLLEEQQQVLHAEFELLTFTSDAKLQCFDSTQHQHVEWQVQLNPNDAKELMFAIQDAQEEFEILMRDL